jgi:hypothetical protein
VRIAPVGQVLEGRYRLSLCAVMHDESYFLPAFLGHYRGLGVERFVILDDASDDGTREMLLAQPDCIVLTSDVRFFEPVDGKRAIYAWRQALLDDWCRDQWAMMVDADEFVIPPPGLSMPDVAARLEREGSASIWGVMIDAYPRDVAALRAGADRPFALDDGWYFDARPHLWARAGRRKPVALYRGARARLMAENRIDEPGKGRWRGLANRVGLGGLMKLNQQSKVPLMRWSAAHRFDGQHRVSPPPTVADVLPMMHFKFTGDLGRKVAYALETRGYAGGSRQYDLMGRLLARMEEGGRSFLGPRSRRYSGPADLYEGGPGRWTD